MSIDSDYGHTTLALTVSKDRHIATSSGASAMGWPARLPKENI